MTSRDEVIARILQLSDKQACYIAKSLTQDVFSNLAEAPTFDQISSQIDSLASTAGVQLTLSGTPDWYTTNLSSDESGATARLLLEQLAMQPGLEDVVDQAIDRYVDESLDLGIITIGVAIALVYLAISGDISVDLGWIKFKKKGLTGSQQKEVVVKTLPDLAKAFVGIKGG
jgi:hypothetical protein